MKKAFFLLVFMAMASSLYAKPYIIFAENAAGLWAKPDGTGCANDIVKAAFHATGNEVSLNVVPYNRAKHLVMQGQALACFSMGWSEELKTKVVFPKTPIYTNTSTIFIRKSDSAKYRTIADIPLKSAIGTALGYEYPVVFGEMVKRGKLVPDTALDESLSLKKLAIERFDFVIMTLDELKTVDFVLKQAGVADAVQPAFAIGSMDIFLGFAIGHPDTPQAIKDFDTGMAIIKKNGTLEKIMTLWKTKI